MRVRVVPDRMSFRVLALQYLWPLAGIESDDEKRCRNVFFFQDVQDFRSPPRIGPVVKRNRQLVLRGPHLLNVIRNRVAVVAFTREKIHRRLICEASRPALRLPGKPPQIAVALEN